MIDAITYTDMLKHISDNEMVEDTIGILITRPDSHTGNSILKSLNYFHHWTSNIINFYLPGYGAYWNSERYPDMINIVSIDRVNWSFSYKAFIEFINTLEKVSKWKYSGESELMLISYHNESLDFSKVLVFNLDAMLSDGTISSVNNFVTGLSRCIKRDNSMTCIAVRKSVKSVANIVMKDIMTKIPTYISRQLNNGRHYICKDFRK